MQVQLELQPNPPTAILKVFMPNSPEVNFTRCMKAKTLPALRSELDRRLAITWSGDIETALDAGRTATGEITIASEYLADFLAI
jgi:hypothetical protein